MIVYVYSITRHLVLTTHYPLPFFLFIPSSCLVDLAVYIAGNPDKLIVKVGLNACVAVTDHFVCASSVPGLDRILPWYALKGAYSFGNICNDNSTSSSSSAGGLMTTTRTETGEDVDEGLVATS